MKKFCTNILVFTLFIFIDEAWSYCALKVSEEFGSLAPILINELDKKFIYPQNRLSKAVELRLRDEVIANCPGSSIAINGISINKPYATLSCVGDTRFKLPNGEVHKFKDIRCLSKPVMNTKEIGRCSRGHLIEIGFNSIASSFIPIMDTCYNKITAGPYWSHNVIPTAILDNESNVKKRSFVQLKTNEVPRDLDTVIPYIRSEQRRILFEIMHGNQTLVDKYVPPTGKLFLARGLLIRRSEQFYVAQQYGTHFYINALPIWQCINEGNWRLIGNEITKLASFTGNLDVYAGGVYILRLPFSSTDDRDIFLAKNKVTGVPSIFVPKLLFKLVYNPQQRRAIVYITINNPFLSSKTNLGNYIICQEYKTCRLRSHPDFQNLKKGYSYCCLYNDFIKDVYVRSIGLPNLPPNVAPLTF